MVYRPKWTIGLELYDRAGLIPKSGDIARFVQ
jgi:hypothetical protein